MKPVVVGVLASVLLVECGSTERKAYALNRRDGIDYNLAYIPETFEAPHREEFDTDYLRTLFDVAYEMVVNGYPWKKERLGL